jgi:hypothetical protein
MIIIQPSASRTTNPRTPAPSVNCWATIIRPLCGLIPLLFGQAAQTSVCATFFLLPGSCSFSRLSVQAAAAFPLTNFAMTSEARNHPITSAPNCISMYALLKLHQFHSSTCPPTKMITPMAVTKITRLL